MVTIKLSTGIVRKVDELGRIVIPRELRRTMGIDIKDPLEIYTEDNFILLRKYEPGCMFCGRLEELYHFANKQICKECRNSIIGSINWDKLT